MSDDLVERLRAEGIAELDEAADRIEKLEAALREIAQTVTIVDENWHPSYHDFSFTQKQAEGAYEELGRRIQIARKALEKKDG
jgi:hypothetical protein